MLSLYPLDGFVDDAAARMEVVGAPDEVPEVQREVQAEIDAAEGRPWPMIGIERYAFYERAKAAYAVIQTGERRFYGCFALRKGVIPPEALSMGGVVILGVFVADTAYRADRAPRMGETILGQRFKLGPGGKGSNQAVAAARLGAEVSLITRLGEDAFADMALAHLGGGRGAPGGDARTRELHRGGLHLHRGGERRQRHHHLPGRGGDDRARRPRRAGGADRRARRCS